MPSICPLTGSAAIGLANGPAALAAVQAHGLMLLGVGIIVSLTPLIIGTLFAHRVLHMNPVIVCGALAGHDGRRRR
jgi:putative transport protein